MQRQVTALVPCFNEAGRIGLVLEVLTQCPVIDDIVVVNDGSTDNSREVIAEYPMVRLVDLAHNVGKGGALRAGMDRVYSPITFLCDADLVGLTCEHVQAMVGPVLNGEVLMCVGVREVGGSVVQFLRRHFLPLLAGERVIATNVLREILRSERADGWGIEPYMNFYFELMEWKVKKIELRGVRDVETEKKRGVMFWLRRLMFYLKVYVKGFA